MAAHGQHSAKRERDGDAWSGMDVDPSLVCPVPVQRARAVLRACVPRVRPAASLIPGTPGRGGRRCGASARGSFRSRSVLRADQAAPMHRRCGRWRAHGARPQACAAAAPKVAVCLCGPASRLTVLSCAQMCEDAPMDIDAAPSAKRRQCTVTGEVLMRLPARRLDLRSACSVKVPSFATRVACVCVCVCVCV